MKKYVFRLENLLLIVSAIVFWGVDIFLALQGVSLFNHDDLFRMHGILFLFLILLIAAPYLFYYRLRKNEITNSRTNNLYFPLTLLLVIVLILVVRIGILPSILTLNEYHKIFRRIYISSSGIKVLTYYLLGIYIILQVIFIIDSLVQIKKYRKQRLEMINKIGSE